MTHKSKPSRASTVAAGIFLSRILGLVRESVVTFFLGVGAHADMLQAAFIAPNVLQNLLGEGAISAAFVPVYSRFLKDGREEDAGRFAGAVFALLVVAVATLVLIGIAFARPIVSVMLYNWTSDAARVAAGELPFDRLALVVKAVRIVFPMAGILVLSAWALGVLNSHRRFFVPYFAPVLWNLAIIAALVVAAQAVMDQVLLRDIDALTRVLFAAFVGALIGGILQFCVQLPLVCRVMKGFRLRLSVRVEGVMTAIRAFGPAVAGRGVSQLSSYVDLFLVTFLAAGGLAAMRLALMLYLLPISLFGLSVAAAELPELSRMSEGRMRPFLARLRASVRQSMFLTMPVTVGYLSVGFLIVAACYRRGAFGLEDNYLVWAVLCAYSLGLVATTISRLLQNAFWVLGNTKTPAKIAALRVVVSAAFAAPLMLWLDQWAVSEVVGLAPDDSALMFGAVGLGLGSAVAAWIELWRLYTSLHGRMDAFALPWRAILVMAMLAFGAAAASLAFWWLLPAWPPIALAGLVVGLFAALYLGSAHLLRFSELSAWIARLRLRSRP